MRGSHPVFSGRPNRDRGRTLALSPPTPPGMRVRTGRFRKLRLTLCSSIEGAGVGLHHCSRQAWLHRALSNRSANADV